MGSFQEIKYMCKDKNVIIRNATVDDAEELIELIRKIDNETTFLLREPDEFTMTLEKEREFLEDKLSNDKELFIIAEVDGKIAGTCGLHGSSRKRLIHSRTLGIALAKEFWGMGIGTRLMDAAINWAKDNGFMRITLEVDTKNYRGISLYTKMGFEVEGTFIKDKKLADGTFTNSYAMALLL